jgi:hypothetical protein
MTPSTSATHNNFNSAFGLSREKVVDGLKNVIYMGPKWVKNHPEISFAIGLISTIASSILIYSLIKQKNKAISDLTESKEELTKTEENLTRSNSKLATLSRSNGTLENKLTLAAQMTKKAGIPSLGAFKVKYEGEQVPVEDSAPHAPAEVITVSIVSPEIRKWISEHQPIITAWEKTERGKLDKEDFKDLIVKEYTFSSDKNSTELSNLTFKRKFDTEYFSRVWSDIVFFAASHCSQTLSLRAVAGTHPTPFRVPLFSNITLPPQFNNTDLLAKLFSDLPPKAKKVSQVLAITDQEPETKET